MPTKQRLDDERQAGYDAAGRSLRADGEQRTRERLAGFRSHAQETELDRAFIAGYEEGLAALAGAAEESAR